MARTEARVSREVGGGSVERIRLLFFGPYARSVRLTWNHRNLPCLGDKKLRLDYSETS